MRPPFEITPLAADPLSKIERQLGRHEGARIAPPSPMLRRSHRVRTIHASLAIEGNTLPGLMNSVLEWLKKDTAVPAPIRAAVCHYELEFIHPFEDGNGRMGRLWHSLILYHYHPLFAQVPIESAIRTHQADYYAVLGRCDNAGNSTEFIEFALTLTLEALAASTALPASKMSATGRIETARQQFGVQSFSRKDYLTLFPTLSPATASRDLQQAVVAGQLTRQGEKATARYQFKPRT